MAQPEPLAGHMVAEPLARVELGPQLQLHRPGPLRVRPLERPQPAPRRLRARPQLRLRPRQRRRHRPLDLLGALRIRARECQRDQPLLGAHGVGVHVPVAGLAVAPFVGQQVLDSLQSCFVPLSYYDFSSRCCETPCGKDQPLARNWTCYSERPNKPSGFITSTVGATLSLRLKMSLSGKVVIGFLRSYERMGSVRVALLDQGVSWVEASSDAITLDGAWDSHTSQAQAAVIDINTKLWGNVSKRQSTRTLGIRFEGGPGAAAKFKVLSVESC